jgi:hypothetical protein
MLLFLFGVGLDLPTIVLVSFILFLFGVLISRFSKKILRKAIRGASDRTINTLSKVCAIFLAPILLIGIFAVIVFASTPEIPRRSEEARISEHYKMMEEDFAEDLRIGMSKIEVMEKFGQIDTAGSVLLLDLSLPDAKEKYFLEINFEDGGLTSFRRQQ